MTISSDELETIPSADADPMAPDADAPFGYMIDPGTGERRAKKRPGKQPRTTPAAPPVGSTPSIESLKAAKLGANAGATADRTPAKDKPPSSTKAKAPRPTPAFNAGTITKGMNKRYRQLGKLMRPLDHDLGQAFITMAKNTAEPEDDGDDADNSVGACWADLARVNTRVRRFCYAVIQGGVYGALVMAHSPLGIAIALKFVSANPGFFGRLILSMSEPDPDADPDDAEASDLPGGLNTADLGELMKHAEKLLPGIGNMEPADVRAMAEQAAAQHVAQEKAAHDQAQAQRSRQVFANGGRGSRKQPTRSTRAARKG